MKWSERHTSGLNHRHFILKRVIRTAFASTARSSSSDSRGCTDFTHISTKGEVMMVDVSQKVKTTRQAVARAIVSLGPELVSRIRLLPKGDVLTTAKIAGIQACKNTASLIPLCHQIPLTECNIEIVLNQETGEALVECRVRTNHETGVEMEALTGAAVASLTIYDMCKAVSKSIVIREIRLISKSGGKHDYCATE